MSRPELFSAAGVCPFCLTECAVDDCEAGRRYLQSLGSSPRIGDRRSTADEVMADYRQSLPPGHQQQCIVGSVSMRLATQLVDWSITNDIELTVRTDPSIAAVQTAIRRDGVVTASIGELSRLADRFVLIGDCGSIPSRLSKPDHDRVKTFETLGNRDIAAWQQQTPNWAAESKYLAIIVGSGALSGSTQEQTVTSERLIAWTWFLNRRLDAEGQPAGRAVLLPIDPQATIREVYRYRTNRSLGPPNDPSRSIQIGSLSCPMAAPVAVQIGGIDPGPTAAARYIPANTESTAPADAFIRCDNSVTLPAPPNLYDPTAPEVTSLLNQ